jgi:hypothetical protein
MRRALMFGLATAAVIAGLGVNAAPAQAQGATVFRLGPEEGCQIGPTDIPGVPVTIPADCFIVATPSGNGNVLLRAEIPAGFAVSDTFTLQTSCFFPGLGPGSGILVAARSGPITAHCHIRA